MLKREICNVCGGTCVYSKAGECSGSVNMMSDTKIHLCEKHKHGAPNNWYESEDTSTKSPFPQELGMGESLSNGGGTYSNEPDSSEVDNGSIRESNRDNSDEDPHYTEGNKNV